MLMARMSPLRPMPFAQSQNLLRENEAISSYDKQVGADGLELCVDAGRFFRGPLQA